MSIQNLKNKAFQNPEVKAEYDSLETEFALIDTLLSMRKKSGLTQDEIAKKWVLKKGIFQDWREAIVIPAGKHCKIMPMHVGLSFL